MSTVTRYVALLRGINLGGRRKVPMPRLRTLAEGLGYREVSTYIASGNLLFSADASDNRLAETLAEAVEHEFGFRVDVAVRTAAELSAAVEGNPYPDGDPQQVCIAFLMGRPSSAARTKVDALAAEHERVTFAGREIYVDFADGQARSKLAATFSDAIGVSSTIRNLRTCQALLERIERLD